MQLFPKSEALLAEAARALRFLAVGALTTATQYLVLIVAVETTGASAVVWSAVGYLCGATVGYFMNRTWTFGSATPHSIALTRFASMVLIGFCVNTLAMRLLTGSGGLGYLVDQVIATAMTLCTNYALSRWWVFRA